MMEPNVKLLYLNDDRQVRREVLTSAAGLGAIGTDTMLENAPRHIVSLADRASAATSLVRGRTA